MDTLEPLPYRASLYSIAKACGMSPQSLYQTSRRNPNFFQRGLDGKYDTKTVLSFLEHNGRPYLRGNTMLPLVRQLQEITHFYKKNPSQLYEDLAKLRTQLEIKKP